MNLNTFLLIDGSLMLIGLPLLMIIKGKDWSKFITFYPYSNSIVDPYPYKGVPQTVHIYYSDSLPD